MFVGAAINPNAQEVIGNGNDQDCDGHDALDRKLYFNSFGAIPWPRSGAVTTVSDGVQIGNGVSAGSITRTVNTLVPRGKVHAVVEVTSKSGAAPCYVSLTTAPWPAGAGTLTDLKALTSGTNTTGALAVHAAPRMVQTITLYCVAGAKMTVDWLSLQNTSDVFPPIEEISFEWEDVEAPAGGLGTTVVRSSLDGRLFAASDLGGIAVRNPYDSADTWTTVNGTAPDALMTQADLGVYDVLPASWGEVFALTGRTSSGDLTGGLWRATDDGVYDAWEHLADTTIEDVGGYGKYAECGGNAYGGGHLLAEEPATEQVYIGSGDPHALGVHIWDGTETCPLPVTGTALPASYVAALARIQSASNDMEVLLVGYRGRGTNEQALYACTLPFDNTDVDDDGNTSEIGFNCGDATAGEAVCTAVTALEGTDVRDLEPDPSLGGVVYVADGGRDPDATSCQGARGGVWSVEIDDSSGSLVSTAVDIKYADLVDTSLATTAEVTGVAMDPAGAFLFAFVPTTHDGGYDEDRIYRIARDDLYVGSGSWVAVNQGSTSSDLADRQERIDGTVGGSLSGAWLEAATVARPEPFPEYWAPGDTIDGLWFDGHDGDSGTATYALLTTFYQLWKVKGLEDPSAGWDPEIDTFWTFWPEVDTTNARTFQETVVNDVALDSAGNVWMPVSDLGLMQLPPDGSAAEVDCYWDRYNAGGLRVAVAPCRQSYSQCSAEHDAVWVALYDQGGTIPQEFGIFRTIDGGASWRYQGAGLEVSDWRAENYPSAGRYSAECKDENGSHVAVPFGSSSGLVFNGGVTSVANTSWGNPTALEALSELAAIAVFGSYDADGNTTTTTDRVTGRIAYTHDGGATWTPVTFDGAFDTNGATADCSPYEFFLKPKGLSLVHPGKDSWAYDRDNDGNVADGTDWRWDFFLASRYGDTQSTNDGQCGLARVTVASTGTTWTWYPLSSTSSSIDCEVDETSMRGVVASPWSDEVYVWGFYGYGSSAHTGGACAIDIDNPALVTELVDPAVDNYSIGDISPHPQMADVLMVAPVLDAPTWLECESVPANAGACAALHTPYPFLLERTGTGWVRSDIMTDLPPSLVATTVGWGSLADQLVLYGTEGAGAWRGYMSW